MCPILSYQNIATLTPVYRKAEKALKFLGVEMAILMNTNSCVAIVVS